MRLDKFLKVSRAIKRRSWAKEACESGAVKINGRLGKSHSDVKIDDIIEINFDGKEKIIRIKILNLPEKGNLSPNDFEIEKHGF